MGAATDLCFRVTYRVAYRAMRAYWALLRPATHGALVAIWHQGKILLVRNSYVRYYSLPGGYVGRNEAARDAALRELREETRVQARLEDLRPVLDEEHEWEGKREHIEIFELETDEPPSIVVDNREVVHAEFFTPERALQLELFPPIRQVIEQRRRASSSTADSA